MLRNVMRSGLVGALLTLFLATAAQAADPSSLLAQAAALNQTYVSQVNAALTASDLATAQARTSTALATGNQLVSVLNSALASATNDADRSRAQGVLDHVNAAQAAGRRVLAATSFDAAHSALEAMRGEAVEANSELLPFASATPVATPTVMPVTGGPGPSDLLGLAATGLALALGGLGLRRALPA